MAIPVGKEKEKSILKNKKIKIKISKKANILEAFSEEEKIK